MRNEKHGGEKSWKLICMIVQSYLLAEFLHNQLNDEKMRKIDLIVSKRQMHAVRS